MMEVNGVECWIDKGVSMSVEGWRKGKGNI
jgi:hypothetical protein